MTLAAQHDFRPGSVGADGAQQATQEGAYFLAARPLGGAKNGGDETALAVGHDNRLKTVLIVIALKSRYCWPPCTASKVSSISRTIRLGTAERTRNRDRPWRGPCATARGHLAGFPVAKSSTANRVRDPMAKDRAPS